MTQSDCEERSDVAISPTSPVILRSVLCDVRISPTRPVIARSAATWQSHFLKFLWI